MPHKTKEGGWKCIYCNEIFRSRKELNEIHYSICEKRKLFIATGKHISSYKIKFLQKCEFCGLEKETTKEGMSTHRKYCKNNPNRENGAWFNKHHSNDSKNKISISMRRAHKEGRAWNIGQNRWKGKKSYPEEFFEKVINNEFNDKDYTWEYHIKNGIYHYSLDFAWAKKKKYIEIDGDQHKRFKEYTERDKRKDAFLKKLGWQVLRIEWKAMFNDPKKYIKIANEFIGQ